MTLSPGPCVDLLWATAVFRLITNTMNASFYWNGLLIILVIVIAQPIASPRAEEPKPPVPSAQRGMYIVEQLVQCSICHSERDWRGRQQQSTWLQGGKLDFKPSRPIPWAPKAPSIAGLPMFKTDEAAIHYFRTGELPDGTKSTPPMPSYRMNAEDAKDVVAYLRSLKGTAK